MEPLLIAKSTGTKQTKIKRGLIVTRSKVTKELR
jgi:hypothetical protein